MHCEQAEMLIPQYIFNELTAEESNQVTEHLKTCAACTQTCKELKEASGFLEAALKAPKEKKFSEEKRQQILAAFSELKPIVEPIALTETKNEIRKKPSFDFKTFFMSIAAIFLVLVGIAGISPMFQGVGDTRSDSDRNVTLGYYHLNEDEKNQNSEYAYSLEDTQKKLASKQEAVQNTEQSSADSNDRTTRSRIGRNSKPMSKAENSLRQEIIVSSKEKQTIPKNQNELGNRGIGFDDNVQDFNNNVVYDGIKPKTQNKAKWGEKPNNTPSSPSESSSEDHKQQIENIKLDSEWEKDTEINKSGVIMTRKKGMAPDLKQLEEGKYYIGPEMVAQTINNNLKANSYGEVDLDDLRHFEFNRNKKAVAPEEDFNTDGHIDKNVELQKFKAGIAANDRKHSDPIQLKSSGIDDDIDGAVNDGKSSVGAVAGKDINLSIHVEKERNNNPHGQNLKEALEGPSGAQEILEFRNFDEAKIVKNDLYADKDHPLESAGSVVHQGGSVIRNRDSNLAPLSKDQLGGVNLRKDKKSPASQQDKEIEALKAELASMQEKGVVDSEIINKLKSLVGTEQSSEFSVDKEAKSIPKKVPVLGDTTLQGNLFKPGKPKSADEMRKTIDQVKSNLTQEMPEANIENGKNQQKGATIADGVVVVEELGSSNKDTGTGAGFLSDVSRLESYDARGQVAKQNEKPVGTSMPKTRDELNNSEGLNSQLRSDLVKSNKMDNSIKKDENETKMETYSVLDLITPPRSFMGPDIQPGGHTKITRVDQFVAEKIELEENSLKDLIMANVAINSWGDAKGTSIEVFQGKLMVVNSEEVQKQVNEFLEKLRKEAKESSTSIAETELEHEEEIDVAPVKPEPKKIVVNPFVNTAADALSTFSIDTDSASYYVCRQSLSSGVIPQESMVRPEEFINAFDYNYCLTGNKTFAISTEYMQNPLNANTHILKVGIKGKVLGRDGRKPVHVVLVVDTSGSMAKKTRLPLVKKGIEKLVTNMHPGDHISLVTYSNDVTLNLEYTPIENIDKIQNAVEAIKTGGSTDLAKGVMVGYQIAANHFKKGAMNQVIICSDGVANVGHLEANKIIKRVEAFKKQGVSFTSIGFGLGDYNDQLLQKLALRGDGFYFFVNSEEDANRVFEREIGASFHIIAKDAKLQVAFKKNRVHRYRLIGYEARDVKDKDFRNNAVDGGEIISGKSVTAIYEIELAKAESAKEFQESLGTVTVRFQNIENNQWEEDTVAIAGKRQVVNQPKENPYFYLAYSVATFAEIMRKSPYVKPNAIDQIETYVKKISEELVLNDQVKDLLKNIQLYQKLTVKDK